MNPLARILLIPPTVLFGGLVWLKNFLYDTGLVEIKGLDAPVISVGNLSMGGAGKSPIVAALIQLLLVKGLKVVVLSRGYGREQPGSYLRVDPAGPWQRFGDEPMMLAKTFPQVEVIVGPKRWEAAQLASERPDVYILDDAFQHRQLRRDRDIVLLDVQQGWPALFPMGLFRESWVGLKRAQLVMLTRSEGVDVSAWVKQIHRVQPNLPILRPTFKATRLVSIQTGEELDPAQIPAGRVAAYAGIARPEKFFDSLAALGLEVVVKEVLPDHGQLSPQRYEALLQDCRRLGLKHLVTTEKDAVKLENGTNSDILLCSLSLIVDWGNESDILRFLNQLLEADL